MRSAAGGGRKAVVAGATGEGAWGGGWGARGAPPPPAPANPTSRDVAGRSGREEGHRPHTRTRTQPGRRRRHRVAGGGARPPGAGEEWRARRGGPAGQGGAGREGSRGGEPPFPDPTPKALHTPPQQPFSRSSSPPRAPHQGRPPTGPNHPGRGAFRAWRGAGVSPSLPFPFPSRAARVEERLASRAGQGHHTALGTDHVNDPSAGSPTETLLRLLLPLDSQVRPSSQRSARAVGRPRRGRSEGLTKPSNR